MSKTRDALIHLSVDVAIKKRKCHHSKKHRITSGQRLLMIRNDGGLGSKNYCVECATEILVAAQKKLAAIVAELGRP